MRPKDKRDYRGDLHDLLISHVGQPWNDVFSKLCRTFDTRKGRDQEIMGQLRWLVERNCHVVDGEVCENIRSRHDRRPRRVRGMYIHPETGLLCNNDPKAEAPAEKPVESFQLDNFTSYEKIGGIWYRLRFKYHDPDKIWRTYRFEDLDPANADSWHLAKLYGTILRKPGAVHHVYYRDVPHLQRQQLKNGGKLQCSKKETEWIEFYLAGGRSQIAARVEENSALLRNYLRQVRAGRTPAALAAGAAAVPSTVNLIAGNDSVPAPQRTVF